ncbi:hypothetical protein SALBM135S_00027 [Streptomyces alboniger]
MRPTRLHIKLLQYASHLTGWYKSSFSGGTSGDCLEVNDSACPAHLPVGDSKNYTGPAVVFPAAAWTAFVDSLGGPRLGEQTLLGLGLGLGLDQDSSVSQSLELGADIV